MHTLLFLSGLLLVGNLTPLSGSPDLTRIDRTIRKEPAYQGKPHYGLLVFGPEAKTRIWLVRDDQHLYIDRNGNGDLTAPGEKATWVASSRLWVSDVPGPDGWLKGRLALRSYPSGVRLFLQLENKRRYMVGDLDTEPLVFASRPFETPVAQIDGPLAIELSYYGSLILRVRVGTPGLGKGTFAALVLPDVTPTAEIEFPTAKPGAVPLVQKVALKDR